MAAEGTRLNRATRLEQNAAHVGQRLAQRRDESTRFRAVDRPVIVAQRHAAAFFAARTRCRSIAASSSPCDTPSIATSGELMIGVNPVPPIAPRLVIVKLAPCRSSNASFPCCAFCDSDLDLFRQIENALLVRVTQHGDDETFRRVHRQSDVEIAFEDQSFHRRIERRVERWKRLQRRNDGFDDERKRRQFYALPLGFRL